MTVRVEQVEGNVAVHELVQYTPCANFDVSYAPRPDYEFADLPKEKVDQHADCITDPATLCQQMGKTAPTTPVHGWT